MEQREAEGKERVEFASFHTWLEKSKVIDKEDLKKKLSQQETDIAPASEAYFNINQQDDKNFVSLRVFATRVKGDMIHKKI